MATGGIGMAATHAVGSGESHHRLFTTGMSGMMDGHGMGGMMDGHGMSGPMGSFGRLQFESTIPGAVEVSVSATEFSFEPSSVEVASQTDFNLTLDNRGTLVHDLVVRGTGLHLVAGPGESASAGVPGLPAGEYEFFCSVPGHAEAGMTGVLVVSGR
jgi:uncharacterized cupredoxin-like copper-binding protein